MRAVHRTHLDDLSFDQFDPLISEQPQFAHLVELFAGPEMRAGFGGAGCHWRSPYLPRAKNSSRSARVIRPTGRPASSARTAVLLANRAGTTRSTSSFTSTRGKGRSMIRSTG